MTTGRTLTITDAFFEWADETPPEVTLLRPGYLARVLPGAHDREGEDGFTLVWTDGVINWWAEHFSDLATAIARLAALERGVSQDEFFRDGPEGFVRWSENFFDRCISKPTIPEQGGGT